jgi:hypothetical protein
MEEVNIVITQLFISEASIAGLKAAPAPKLIHE